MTEYSPPLLLSNRHFATIFPALLRSVKIEPPLRERITTPDNDFLDLDWYKRGSKNLVIISHGLEGNSQRAYVRGMARACVNSGLDVLAWNFRGCSGEMNLVRRFYHSGATDDLDTVVRHAMRQGGYESINLIGFSLGGNLTLKYLGEDFASVCAVTKAVVISVPLDLDTSCTAISQRENWVYQRRFLKSLKKKVTEKNARMDIANASQLDSIKTLREFDDAITGPLHGFINAKDYYEKCSAINFLSKIRTPALVINARNDPFLSKDCFPENNVGDFVQFTYPTFGGHVGFTLFNEKNLYWSEIRALEFLGVGGR
jgi:uncharacterized protein